MSTRNSLAASSCPAAAASLTASTAMRSRKRPRVRCSSGCSPDSSTATTNRPSAGCGAPPLSETFMFNRRHLAIAIVLTLGATVALACGPDFPWQLLDDRAATLSATPSNSFAYEAAHLAPVPKDDLKAVEFDEYQQDQARASFADAEAAGLSADQSAAVSAMRGADSEDDALAKGAIVPAAVRLYTAGAVDFIKTDEAKAAVQFQ